MAHIPVVGLWRRLFAMLYDTLLLFGVLLIASAVGMLFTGNEATESWLMNLWFLFVTFIYFAWPWTLTGQTLGMKTWKIRLLSEEGKRVTWLQALIRFLTAIPSIAVGGLGLWWLLVDENKLAMHDRFSKTVLVDLKKIPQN